MCVCENECARFFLGNTKTNNNKSNIVGGMGRFFLDCGKFVELNLCARDVIVEVPLEDWESIDFLS